MRFGISSCVAKVELTERNIDVITAYVKWLHEHYLKQPMEKKKDSSEKAIDDMVGTQQSQTIWKASKGKAS